MAAGVRGGSGEGSPRRAVLLLGGVLVGLGAACGAESTTPAHSGAGGMLASSGGAVALPSGGTPSSGGAPNAGGAPSAGTGGTVSGGAGSGAAGAPSGQGGTAAGSGGTSIAGSSAAGGRASGAGAGGVGVAGANSAGANAGTAGSAAGAGGSAGFSNGADPKFLIFLLIGQSNMVGQPQPQTQDLQQDPRIKVLAYDDCSNVNRKYNQWYTAYPPLHQCDGGVGPGDYFAKTLLESLPEGYTIGLVPLGVNGAPIDVFRKNVPRPGWTLPPDNHWETGFEWIVSRANEAQKVGVIRGILFHQGESDMSSAQWPGHVQGLVSDLRTDLGIGEVPFLAGEFYYGGCCAGQNVLIKAVTDSIPNAFPISAMGLNGVDQFHFDLAGQREFGKRYGIAMQGALTIP